MFGSLQDKDWGPQPLSRKFCGGGSRAEERAHAGRPGLCQLQGEKSGERRLISVSPFTPLYSKSVG